MSDSFGKFAKNEVALSALNTSGEETAFLSGLIHTAGSIMISRGNMELVIPLENARLSDRVCFLLKKAYGEIAELCSEEKKILLGGKAAERVLEDCKIYFTGGDGEKHINPGVDTSLIGNERKAAAYLKGAFLGGGSVSVVKGYHLEFSLSNARLAGDLADILRNCGINANVTERKDKFVSYVKGSDGVSGALAFLGASKSVLELNNRFADRELSSRVNRQRNCDLANIDKAVTAAARQQEAIEKLRNTGRFDELGDKLKETARLREENPEMTLSELANAAGISKSGMKHRLSKLIEISEK